MRVDGERLPGPWNTAWNTISFRWILSNYSLDRVMLIETYSEQRLIIFNYVNCFCFSVLDYGRLGPICLGLLAGNQCQIL